MKRINLIVVFVCLIHSFSFCQKMNFDVLVNTDQIRIDSRYQLTITDLKQNEAKLLRIKTVNDSSEEYDLKSFYDQQSSSMVIDLDKFRAKSYKKIMLILDGVWEKELLFPVEGNRGNDEGVKSTKLGLTGIAYWDAKYILQLWYNKPNSVTAGTIAKIIDGYRIGGKEYAITDLVSNPFFKSSKIIGDMISSKAGGESAGGGIQQIIGGLSGLDVTKYVQALADFLRDRMKEELTIAYLAKLKETINGSNELKILLPATISLFNKSNPFAIPDMGPTYKAAFASDIENLLPNFEKLILTSPAEPFVTLRKTGSFKVLQTASMFVDMTARNYHPADILRRLSLTFPLPTSGAEGHPIPYLIQVANVFSRELIDTSGTKWVDKNKLYSMSIDELAIFFGLIYERNQRLFDIQLTGQSAPLVEKIKNLLNLKEAGDVLYDYLMVLNTLDSRIQQFKETANDRKKELILTLFSNNSDAILEVLSYVGNLTGLSVDLEQRFSAWKDVADRSVKVAKAVKENDLGSIGSDIIQLIDVFVPSDETWKKQLSTYIQLLTSLVTAKESADIKALLNKYAEPVHSYRVSRQYTRSYAITAYPGLYSGVETNFKYDKSTAFSWGVTAPVGFAFSSKATASKAAGRSNSLFISVFDIGAALSYRFNNDTADLPEKITLGQIFSPGIFYVSGWKNSPVALKFGAQYCPQLRTIKDGANVLAERAGVVRFSIGLSVDIPLWIMGRKE